MRATSRLADVSTNTATKLLVDLGKPVLSAGTKPSAISTASTSSATRSAETYLPRGGGGRRLPTGLGWLTAAMTRTTSTRVLAQPRCGAR